MSMEMVMNDSDIRKVKVQIAKVLFKSLIPALFITILTWMILSFDLISNALMLSSIFFIVWITSFVVVVRKYWIDYTTKMKIVESFEIKKGDVKQKTINSTAMYCAQKYGISQCAKTVDDQNSFTINRTKVSVPADLYASFEDGDKIEVSVAKYSRVLLSVIIND